MRIGKSIIQFLNKPLARIGLVLVGALLVIGMAWEVHLTQVPPAQPIEFPHFMHINVGIQCLYCHPGALRGPSPGLPTESKCWACHQQITVRNSEIDKLINYVQSNSGVMRLTSAIKASARRLKNWWFVSAGCGVWLFAGGSLNTLPSSL